MPPVELILYLEPSFEFKNQFQTFLDECKRKFGFTTANKYSCHVTMTGFFNVDNEQQQDSIKKFLDKMEFNHSPVISMKSLLVRDQGQEPVHLLLPVTVPDSYHTLMSSFANQCGSIAPLRLKKINHISLAYWDEPMATPEQQKKWTDAVNDHVFEHIQEHADLYFRSVSAPKSWDIAFYKRTIKGESVGQVHVFEEIGRWKIQ